MELHKETKHFEADQGQDLFALGLFPEGGTFLDIGSGGPIRSNNTYMLEQNGWKGICVDNISEDNLKKEFLSLESAYKEKRESQFFNIDACSDEFIDLITEHYPSKTIDYISLDIDSHSLECLVNIIKNGFNFKCMTFEHDLYQKKPINYVIKYQSKDLLLSRGYFPVFENVGLNGFLPLEDWWINLNYFPEYKINCSSYNLPWENCIHKLGFFIRRNKKNELFVEKFDKIFKEKS